MSRSLTRITAVSPQFHRGSATAQPAIGVADSTIQATWKTSRRPDRTQASRNHRPVFRRDRQPT